jgi:hypothetical protein
MIVAWVLGGARRRAASDHTRDSQPNMPRTPPCICEDRYLHGTTDYGCSAYPRGDARPGTAPSESVAASPLRDEFTGVVPVHITNRPQSLTVS